MNARVQVSDYQPDTHLDDVLASLCYRAVMGRADQRPITPGLVASRLRPGLGQPATQLATVRADGRLIGAAALRWPYVHGGTGRLWGPVVHPDHQGHGLGHALLTALADLIGFGPRQVAVVATAEIPSAAATAHALFAHAGGWTRTSGVVLLKSPIPPLAEVRSTAPIHTAADYDQEALAATIARLYAATYPDHPPAVTASTLARWAADHRYQPAGLLLIGPNDRPNVAVLTYLLAHTDPTEPTELLIADLIAAPGGPAEYRVALVNVALTYGRASGAATARALAAPHRHDAIVALTTNGLRRIDRPTTYTTAR